MKFFIVEILDMLVLALFFIVLNYLKKMENLINIF